MPRSLLVPMAALLLVAAAAPAPPAEGAGGPWSFDFTPARGVSLAFRGVPVLRQSTLYVVQPGWTGLLFDQRRERPRVARPAPGELVATLENDVFRAEYRLQALDDRRFRLRFEGQLRQPVPAQIEYAAGYFNANLIAGRPFRAETARGPLRGVVPAFPASASQAENDLAPHFRALEVESRIGRLRLEVASEGRVMFFDARRDPQEWARAAPVFWMGLGAPARSLTAGVPVRFELLVAIQPPAGSGGKRAGRSARGENPPREARLAPRLRWEARPRGDSSPRGAGGALPVVIPQPKSLRPGEGAFRLAPGVAWSVAGPEGARAELLRVAEAFREAAEARLGGAGALPPPALLLRPEGEAQGATWTRLRAGDGAARPEPLPQGPPEGDPAGEWARNPEGYRLQVDARGIEILAPTPRGAFYGVQTLAQLLPKAPLPVGSGAKSLRCPAVVVEDWPSMRFRGAHWFPSATGVPFHRRLVERIMARYKLNAAVIQCEAARWESHPEIAAPNSISTAELRGLVELCRRHFIEPIPLINVPGHAEWLFRNGQNLDLAEDPETPYACCVNHPRAARVVREILAEALEIFRPRLFHLGHDEVTLRGRFPNPECPRCAGRSVTELVLTHARSLSGWLRERGVGTMIWGDMLLAREEGPDAPGMAAHAPNAAEARARRAGLPKDLLVADWQYAPAERYPSLDLLRQAGLTPIACTWHEPLNIYRFARAARAADSPGLLQTTWCGYFPDERVLETELRQFTAFLLAAEYAWSGRPEPPSELPWDPGAEFSRAWFAEEPEGTEGQAARVPLGGAARVSAEDWLGLGPGWDLTALAAGGNDLVLEGVPFRLTERRLVVLGAGHARGADLPVRGPGALERLAVELRGGRAREIALLHATPWQAPNGTPAARMTVRYTDGSAERLELVLGRTTAAWTDTTAALRAPVAWRARPSGGRPADVAFALRLTRWRNPHPDRPIARLLFEPADPEPGWLLAGLTLLR